MFVFDDDIWCVRGITPHIIAQLSNIAKPHQSRVVYTTGDERRRRKSHVVFQTRLRDGNEAKQMLLERAGKPLDPGGEDPREAFNSVLRWGNGLPLSLGIAGSAEREILERGLLARVHDAWREYFARTGLKNILMQCDDHRRRNISDSVMLSLDFIDDSCRVTAGSTRQLPAVVSGGH